MRYLAFLWILIPLFFSSCSTSDQKDNEREVIARVNDTYLSKEDIKGILPEGISSQDSINRVRNFINLWAVEQLFMDQSKRNLTFSEQKEYDKLVEDYRQTLYVNAYKDAIIKKSIDLSITNEDIKKYYEENSENFTLKEDLIKLRYLHLPSGFDDIVATQTRFNRFNDDDKEDLLQKKLEFITYSLEDSTWIEIREVLRKIPVLKKQPEKRLVTKGKYIQTKDSLGTYMVKIEDVREKNTKPPISFIKPVIKQIIINRRKQELIKKIEKDITKDAIENKQFEIFED